MPRFSARTDSWVPMLPYPTMPRRRPRTSWLPSAALSQTPSCMPAFFSVSRRVIAMISASASSTTERVLENGALNTATPTARRRGQVDLVGADAERADRDEAVGGVQHLRRDLGLGPDAEQVHPGDPLDQLGPRRGRCGRTRPGNPRPRAGTPRRDGCSPAGGRAPWLGRSSLSVSSDLPSRAGPQNHHPNARTSPLPPVCFSSHCQSHGVAQPGQQGLALGPLECPQRRQPGGRRSPARRRGSSRPRRPARR